MKIITVIPLSRSKIASELSYFTANEVPVGAVVTVPMRSKTVHAIVTGSQDVEDVKMAIKDAPFTIRKLDKIKANAFFPTVFMDTCKLLSEYYATNIGSIVDSFVSESILENASVIHPPLPRQTSFVSEGGLAGQSKEATYAIQGDDTDRFSSWRSLIRQEFARKRSIVIYSPTIEDSKNIFSTLEKGIEGYIFELSASLSKKKIIDTWNAIADTEHPVVVVATGYFPILPRKDIDTIIIERENSRGWKAMKTPYMDLRHALEVLGRKRRQTVFLADSMLSSETLFRLENEDIERGSPFKWRSISTARDILIDMKQSKASGDGFRIVSKELELLIEKNHSENTHLFILAVRRGLAPTTVCDDCETIVTCNNCSSPVVLHTSKQSGKNFFMCHKCGERRSAEETCRNCGGWRLTPLGIGIERVREEIKAKFPHQEIFQIDKDNTKTDKQIKEALERFRARPGSILLGTEAALLHLTDKIEHLAVVSLDSLFALPDFRIQEKIMYMLIRMRAQASQTILVQTRKAEEKIFEYALKGNLSDYSRTAIAERKQFMYPPFTQLIKLTIEGKKDEIAADMAEVQKALDPVEIDIFPAFTSTQKGNSVIHGLIKIEHHSWPDPILSGKIRSLPPYISVKVNPDSLL